MTCSLPLLRWWSDRRPRAGPTDAWLTPMPPSVAGGQREAEALFLELLPEPLEPLILREREWPAVALALELSRRVLDVRLHEVLDRLADRDHHPGTLRVVVHEDVVALLRVLPEVEDLGHRGDVLVGALPAEVRVHGESAGGLTVVPTQVEQRLVVADTRGAGRQLVLGEVEPGLS